MNITEITKKAGAHPRKWRVGRGEGSGSGKTSGRGHKGSGQRAGNTRFELYVGGMFPFFRRIPKYGFSNVQFRKEYQVVNLSDLERLFDDGAHVTCASLEEAGLIRDTGKPVKVLADGELKKKLTVDAHRFSAASAKQIEARGGSANWLGPKPKKKFIKRPKPAEAKPVAKSKKSGKSGDADESAAASAPAKQEGGE